MMNGSARTVVRLPFVMPSRAQAAVVEVAREPHVRSAHQLELSHQVAQRNVVVAGDGGVLVLVESGQRLLSPRARQRSR
jgi:hypothetical protein